VDKGKKNSFGITKQGPSGELHAKRNLPFPSAWTSARRGNAAESRSVTSRRPAGAGVSNPRDEVTKKKTGAVGSEKHSYLEIKGGRESE